MKKTATNLNCIPASNGRSSDPQRFNIIWSESTLLGTFNAEADQPESGCIIRLCKSPPTTPMQGKIRFQPMSFSWVALHPKPQGIVYFIGGAGFGSLPTLCYRHFLNCLFQKGYTIVALPFQFSFRHWTIALTLLEEQKRLLPLLVTAAVKAGYESYIYQQPSNYYWIGHSLGCKYIALLELLSGSEWMRNVEACIDEMTAQWLARRLPGGLAIRDQRSLLIAPDISDTESAIPCKAIAKLLTRLNLGVRPSQTQTKCLIRHSQLFNLTAMISFDLDQTAGSVTAALDADNDVRWLFDELQRLPQFTHQELSGKHLEPIGIRIGNYLVDFNPFDKFIKPLSQWQLESVVLEFLEKLS